MAENRIPRDMQTREATTRKKAWERPDLLPNPKPAEGYAYRWVRVATQGEHDPRNINSKLREGWRPVLAAEHPEIEMLGGPENARFPDNIVIGGLMLCKAPNEMVRERAEHFEAQAESQMKAVDGNFMRESDPRMPMFKEHRSQVRFGKGSTN